ncbi:hypothetical protein NWFMUON74_01820 [Nocardia wallacei]|uniref:Uncharacterized protein n=1 Tax=Nocardia wallacei TaxID=480035 RepID=A0A7G1KC09_9NOCA|nr:hypothetical protein NWFMUON74_01820 [Nocardia wallacei]
MILRIYPHDARTTDRRRCHGGVMHILMEIIAGAGALAVLGAMAVSGAVASSAPRSLVAVRVRRH